MKHVSKRRADRPGMQQMSQEEEKGELASTKSNKKRAKKRDTPTGPVSSCLYHRLASVSLFLDRICVFLLCLSSFLPYRPLSSFHPNPSNGLDRSTRNSDSPLASASFDFRYIACVMRGRIEIFSSTYHLLCFSLLLSLKPRIPHPLPLPFCWSFFCFFLVLFSTGPDGTVPKIPPITIKLTQGPKPPSRNQPQPTK